MFDSETPLSTRSFEGCSFTGTVSSALSASFSLTRSFEGYSFTGTVSSALSRSVSSRCFSLPVLALSG